MSKKIALPVSGCENCELIVETVGLDEATACDECVMFGEAEIVDIDHPAAWSWEDYDDGQPDWAQEWHDFDPDCQEILT